MKQVLVIPGGRFAPDDHQFGGLYREVQKFRANYIRGRGWWASPRGEETDEDWIDHRGDSLHVVVKLGQMILGYLRVTPGRKMNDFMAGTDFLELGQSAGEDDRIHAEGIGYGPHMASYTAFLRGHLDQVCEFTRLIIREDLSDELKLLILETIFHEATRLAFVNGWNYMMLFTEKSFYALMARKYSAQFVSYLTFNCSKPVGDKMERYVGAVIDLQESAAAIPIGATHFCHPADWQAPTDGGEYASDASLVALQGAS